MIAGQSLGDVITTNLVLPQISFELKSGSLFEAILQETCEGTVIYMCLYQMIKCKLHNSAATNVITDISIQLSTWPHTEHRLQILNTTLDYFVLNNTSYSIITLTVLVEADVRGSLSEALSAHVNTVLSDQTGVRRADTALSRALTVVSGVGKPNRFVSHYIC